jgi:hypothetical protein
MKRITTVLRGSEAMIVRRAVYVAGGERVVITPLPYRMCGVDMVDIYSEKRIRESDKQVRLDVTSDDSLVWQHYFRHPESRACRKNCPYLAS